MDKELEQWTEKVTQVHLPRWEELPDVRLYRDEVITLINRYVENLVIDEESNIITPSMINNYVKWKMIPPPEKKQYDKEHLGYLIAITILKQVMPIGEIKEGIRFQAMICGTHRAYNYFCEEQENALKYLCSKVNPKIETAEVESSFSMDDIALKMATWAFASKLISLKKVGIQKEYLGNSEKKERK